jgi:hypothetical protein
MEYIKKEELIEGEIYVFDNKFINKIQNGHLNIKCWISIPDEYFYKNSSNNQTNNIINATSEEKHWLNEAIKLDKFITFEEAMKTFIPEYVEAIQQSDGYTIGKIYKTLSDSTEKWYKNIDDKNRENGWNYLNFKPSTKEAYDAQFVVKEPAENKTELEIWLENTKSLNLSLEDLEKYIGSGQTCNFDNIYMELEGHYSKGRAKILFDKWNEKVIEPLPQFKVIETIETITKVENNEGNQFFIDDEVIGSKTKIKSKIISFKYNVDKTAILAITDKAPNIGIGINHLEHYIEPKVEVEETLLDKAKRLYPIGTKVKTVCFGRVTTIKTDIFHEISHDLDKVIYADNGNISIYSEKENHWATIIE